MIVPTATSAAEVRTRTHTHARALGNFGRAQHHQQTDRFTVSCLTRASEGRSDGVGDVAAAAAASWPSGI